MRKVAIRCRDVRRGHSLCQRRVDQDVAGPERLGDADGRLRQHALLEAQPEPHQRRQAPGRLDLLDRRAARSRGLAARDRRHDVRAHAVPEQRLCARPQRREQDHLEVRAEAGPDRHPGDVLRHGQPRPRLCATARSSCTRPTRRWSRSTPRPARWCGAVKNGDPKIGETNTNAPHVVKDKVIIGISGGEFGVRGRVTAYDIKTGKQVWRGYCDGPGRRHADRPGEDHDLDLGKPVGKDSSLKTWQGDQWKIGGGTHLGLVLLRSRSST